MALAWPPSQTLDYAAVAPALLYLCLVSDVDGFCLVRLWHTSNELGRGVIGRLLARACAAWVGWWLPQRPT